MYLNAYLFILNVMTVEISIARNILPELFKHFATEPHHGRYKKNRRPTQKYGFSRRLANGPLQAGCSLSCTRFDNNILRRVRPTCAQRTRTAVRLWRINSARVMQIIMLHLPRRIKQRSPITKLCSSRRVRLRRKPKIII